MDTCLSLYTVLQDLPIRYKGYNTGRHSWLLCTWEARETVPPGEMDDPPKCKCGTMLFFSVISKGTQIHSIQFTCLKGGVTSKKRPKAVI